MSTLTFLVLSKFFGFSLFEALITLALAGMMTTLSFVGLARFLKAQRAEQHLIQLQHAIGLAKTSALHQQLPTVLCPSEDQQQCHNTWSHGWIIFVDANRNQFRDSDETLLYTQTALPGKDQLILRAFPKQNYLSFDSRGRFSASNGSFFYCPTHHPQGNRGLFISNTGRTRLSEDSDFDGWHEDSQGEKITC